MQNVVCKCPKCESLVFVDDDGQSARCSHGCRFYCDDPTDPQQIIEYHQRTSKQRAEYIPPELQSKANKKTVMRPQYATYCKKGRPDYLELGQRIAARRKELGLSQTEVARRVKVVNNQTYSCFEQGKATPTQYTANILSEVLGIEIISPIKDRVAA